MAIDEIGVSRAGDVGDVARVHAHLRPHAPLGSAHAVFAGKKPSDCRALPIEGAGAGLEAAQDFVRVEEAPIGKHDHVLAVVRGRIGARRIDDQRTEMTHRFLQAGMAVIPIGARLANREVVGERLARANAREADARHAIHLEGQQNAMPVDGGVFIQRVGDGEARVLAFAKAYKRRRQRAVDGDGVAGAAADTEGRVADGERDIRSVERCERRRNAARSCLRPSRKKRLHTGERAGAREGLQHFPALYRHDDLLACRSWRLRSAPSHHWKVKHVCVHLTYA